MAQPPVKFDRAGAKREGYTDAEIDAYLAQRTGGDAASATTAPTQPASSGVNPRTTTPAEHIVGAVRTGMNALTMGQYPKMVSAANRALGIDRPDDAQKLAALIADYGRQNPGIAKTAEVAGEVAPYFFAAPVGKAAVSVGGTALRATPEAMAVAGRAANSAYQAVKKAPILGRMLPASAKTAAEIAAIEGTRGASQAEGDENALVEGAKSAAGGLALGRAGEIAGTYLAGKFGPSIDKMTAEIKNTAQNAGERMNQWRETAQVQVTPALSKLYQRSKALRTAVNTVAEDLGLPATHPAVLQEAYSTLSKDATPTFREQILNPFMDAIDEAASKPLSLSSKAYHEAQDLIRAITRGKETGHYLRTGAGEPERAGANVLLERMGRQYVTDAERQAAAAGLIASIGERNTEIPTTLAGILKGGIRATFTGGPRGVGQIADVAQRLGGGTAAQQLAQRTATTLAASRSPRR